MPRGSPRQRSAEAVPSSLPPSGPAGGNLGGVFPTPTVIGFTGSGGAFLPTTALFAPSDNTVDIGSSATRVKDVHAVRFIAHADATDTIKATLSATALAATVAFNLNAATTLSLERVGGGQLQLTATGATWLQAGAVVRTDVLASAGAVSHTYAAGVTSVSYGQTVHAAGAAGNPWFIRAQQGAAGFVGGTLTIGGGDGGTPGTQLAGNTIVQLGTAVGTTTASLQFLSGAVTFGELLGTSALVLRNIAVAGPGASGVLVQANAGFVHVQSVVGALFLETNTGQFYFLTGNRIVDWYGAGVLARSDVYHATGATSYTHAAGTTSVTWGQTQDGSAAGATWTIQAQRGFAGTRGGNLILGGGQGGTLGTNLSGDTRIELGDTDGSNDSARLGFYIGGGGERGWLQNATSGGVENLWLHSRKSWIISAFVDTKLAGSIADGVKLRNAADTVTKFQTNDTGIGFYAAAPVAQQTINGSRLANPALADLLTKLALTGLIVDATVI